MKVLKVLLIATVILALILLASHICRLNIWLNTRMGNMDYNPDLDKDLKEHSNESHFEDRDKVLNTLREYKEIMREVYIDSFDQTRLGGDFLLGENPNLRVILIHGYTAKNIVMFTIADQYYKRGYSILAPDLRGHGKSSGIFTSYGIKEKEDIKARIFWIKSFYPDAKIILQGESMGAATAMYLAGENPKDVISTIEDCGYTSYYEMYENKVKGKLRIIAKPAALLANLFIKPIIGADLFKSNIDSMKNTNIPVLFINGGLDEIVPKDMCQRLYEAHSGIKEIYIAKRAGHAESKLYDADIYFQRIFSFLDNILKNNI